MPKQRAGGYVDKGDGKGWVLDDAEPKPPPKAEPHKPMQPVIKAAGGWAIASDPEPSAPEPEKPAKKSAAKKSAAKKSSKGDDG